MQCLICNKSSLFAPKLNTLKKQGKEKYQISLWSKKHFQVFLKQETLIHSYMKLRHVKQYCNAM
jgi:hypothetical protein